MTIANTLPFRDLMIVSLIGQTATAKIFDADSPRLKVLDVWCIQRAAGAASDTLSVDDGTSDITDVMDLNKAIKVVTRAAKIDTAKNVLVKGSTLQVTWDVGNSDADVYVLCQLLH